MNDDLSEHLDALALSAGATALLVIAIVEGLAKQDAIDPAALADYIRSRRLPDDAHPVTREVYAGLNQSLLERLAELSLNRNAQRS